MAGSIVTAGLIPEVTWLGPVTTTVFVHGESCHLVHNTLVYSRISIPSIALNYPLIVEYCLVVLKGHQCYLDPGLCETWGILYLPMQLLRFHMAVTWAESTVRPRTTHL